MKCDCDSCKMNKKYDCKICSHCGEWAYPEFKCWLCEKVLDKDFLCIMTDPESSRGCDHFCSEKCLIERFMHEASKANVVETTTDKLGDWSKHEVEREIERQNKPVFKPNRALRRAMGGK